MPDVEILDSLRRHLAKLGCPAGRADRLLREVAAHLEEGEGAARAGGLSAPAAKQQAAADLGDPAALAGRFLGSLRQAHWCGRHRWLAFAVLPALAVLGWFLGWMALASLLDQWWKFTGIGASGVAPDMRLVKLVVYSVYYSGMVAVPAFFYWLALTRCCGWTAMLLACASCALHALFLKLTLSPHGVTLGYGMGGPEWAGVLAPLLIGALAWRIQRRGLQVCHARPDGGRFATLWLALISAGLTGCATRHPTHERGWIGGEYKLARPVTAWAGDDAVPAFPGKLPGTQRAGILVTALSSNAPAYLAGIRPGDLVLKVAGQPASKLSGFRKAIDRASPGRMLTLSVFRDGQLLEPRVTVGREIYRDWRRLRLGAPRFANLDLWPDPDFSLVALGYRRDQRRAEVAAPESQFILAHGSGAPDLPRPTEARSPEGWSFWLPLVELGSFKRIVSQEAVEAVAVAVPLKPRSRGDSLALTAPAGEAGPDHPAP